MAALAQNGDGLRADQAGAADHDDLHGLTSLVDDWRPLNGFRMQVRTSQEHNAKAHDTSSATPTRMSRIVPRATFRQIGKKRMPIETGTDRRTNAAYVRAKRDGACLR